MLRRNSSKLDRRKSTSSVHSKHDSIDPEVARQHAHTAATLAFARAQERHSTDMGHRGGGISRSNTTSSHHDQQQSQAGEAAANVVRRQHSVRFAGPNAVQSSLQRRQSLGTRAPNGLTIPRPSQASLRPMAMTTNAPVPAEYRPPSRSSSIGKASTGKATAESFVTALAAYNEYYTQEDDVASTPSSYRRLRRSKSMFSPLKAPDVFYTNGTPERPVRGFRCGAQSIATSARTPQIDQPAAALKAPKSMSFLRGGRDHLTTGLHERNDEAVQMARDRFFHQASQQRLREQPSFLFRSKAQRQEKPFRQSVRTSSSNSYGMPVASTNQLEQPKESKLKGKARRASKNIKERLRRAFGRSKEVPVEVPNQQVDARETHVRKYLGDSSTKNDSFDNIPHPNRTTLQRVNSRPPSLHPASSTEQLKSYAGSIKSIRSNHSDDKSRVTSWNSTGVNTIASHGVRPQSERDLQRLSVINENGTHVPSSSFIRQKLSNQFSAYPVLHRPSKSLEQICPPSGSVDSARVYSALMKRLEENSPQAKLEAAKMASLESLNAPKHFPPRISSVHSSHGSRTPATIRQVPQSSPSSENGDSVSHDHQWVKTDSLHSARAENVFGYTGTHVHQWVPADSLRKARMRDQDDVFSPKSMQTSIENGPNRKENAPTTASQRGRSDSALSQKNSIQTSYHTVPENLGLTPQEIAARNEPSVQGGKKFRETKSTFFGGTSFTIARTQSPFRRALAEADYNAAAPISLDDFPMPNPLNIQPKRSMGTEVVVNDPHEVDNAYTESVYSRTTSGQVPGVTNSALSLPLVEDEIPEVRFQNTSAGDVVILDRTTYRPAVPTTKGHRVTSSASSTEWKKWMSSEVAKLERAKDHTSGGSYVNYALPTMPKFFHAGHVRESAQINDDDTDIAQPKVRAVHQPLGIIQQTTAGQNMQQSLQNPPLLKPILKNKSAVSLFENVEPVNNNTSSIPIPPPPPNTPRSPRRQVESKESKSSLCSNNTVHTFHTVRTQSAPNSPTKVSSVNGRNLLHKHNPSQSTLRSTRSLDTPAKLVKRNIRKVSNTPKAPSSGGSLAFAVEKQFGSTSTGSKTPGVAWGANSPKSENRSPAQKDDVYGADGAGLMGPVMSGGVQEFDAQQMGSKRMVDLFLSSRRRRIASENESEVGVGVFI
jgi:hypothetical protein